MSGTKTYNLMSIASDSSLRIHERIKRIKGSDKKISSVEEARAILAISSKDLVWTDNKEALPIAQMEANNFLNEHEKKLKEKQQTDNPSWITKGIAVAKEINKSVKAVGQVLSFADKIRKNVPIYF